MLAVGCGASHVEATATAAGGSVRCAQVEGSVVFSPPLTATGTSPETVTVTAALSRCSTSGSAVRVTGGVATLTIPVHSSACAGLAQFPTSSGGVSTPTSSQALTIRTTWTPAGIEPSALHFTGFVVTIGPSGEVGFAFPGQNHSSTMSGSFAGQDHGALSTASVQTGRQAGQILSDCSGHAGLSSIPIDAGEVRFG